MSAGSVRVLAVITARGGLGGTPRKNVLSLAGRPLISWTVGAARAAQCVARVVVSTDDAAIAEVTRAERAEVRFMGLAGLATDTAGPIAVVRHGIGQCPGHDVVLLRQATSRRRTAEDVDAAFARMRGAGVDMRADRDRAQRLLSGEQTG